METAGNPGLGGDEGKKRGGGDGAESETRRLPGQRVWILVGLIIAFGWTFLLAGRDPSLTNVHNDLVTIAAEWIVVILLGVIGFGILKRDIGHFGLRAPSFRDVGSMLAVLAGTYVIIGVASRLLRVQTSMLDIEGLLAVPFAVKLGLVLTAGICEEFMFRGFAIEELAGWTGSVWLGGLLSWLAFSLAHVDRYGLTTGLIIPAIAGGTLTLLYVWRRNLPVCMVLHAFFDGLSIFLLPVLMKGHGG
jgi:membrane protease YdiL (CAAX protease family)